MAAKTIDAHGAAPFGHVYFCGACRTVLPSNAHCCNRPPMLIEEGMTRDKQTGEIREVTSAQYKIKVGP